MALKLVLPSFDRGIEGGTIAQWHVREGESVGFGDDLFDLHVTERITLRRPLQPRFILKRKSKKAEYNRPRAATYYRVVSADMGVVREIKVEEGQDVRVGGVAAVLSLDPGEDMETELQALETMAEMRVSVDIIEEGADL